jgi:hypothetical protein
MVDGDSHARRKGGATSVFMMLRWHPPVLTERPARSAPQDSPGANDAVGSYETRGLYSFAGRGPQHAVSAGRLSRCGGLPAALITRCASRSSSPDGRTTPTGESHWDDQKRARAKGRPASP